MTRKQDQIIADLSRRLRVSERLRGLDAEAQRIYLTKIRAAVEQDVETLTEALRLTVEYVGNGTLPAQEGWSWYDALRRYAPEKAAAFVESPVLSSLEGTYGRMDLVDEEMVGRAVKKYDELTGELSRWSRMRKAIEAALVWSP